MLLKPHLDKVMMGLSRACLRLVPTSSQAKCTLLSTSLRWSTCRNAVWPKPWASLSKRYHKVGRLQAPELIHDYLPPFQFYDITLDGEDYF